MHGRPLNSTTGNAQDYRGLLVAKVTAVHEPTTGLLSGRKVYEWTEHVISAAGGDEEPAQARAGAYTSATVWDNVLLDANDADLTIDSYVWARMKGAVGGATVYEAVTPQLTTTSPTPAPSVTPLNCPVSSPDACCLPTDVDCCPTIYYEMATSPSTGQLVTGTSYYVDCDGRRVYEDSPTWAASDTCAGGWGDGMYVQCSPHPATGELRYYYESIGCRTCDEIVAAGGTVDDCVSPNPINGPVCVTIAGGTGAFSGVTGTSTSQEIGPDLSVRVDFEFPTLVVSIDGSLVFNAGEPGGWYFVGTATSTQDAGSVPYECGCQVTIPMGLLSGSGVTQTVTAGPVLGSPPTQTLLVETPCGDFTLAIGACPVSPPAPTYNCAEETYCYDPGDGTGTYTGGTALADCEAACGGGSTPPVPSGCCDGTGESLEGNPNLELVIPNGYLAGTYTLVYSASVLNLSGGYGPGWYVDVTLVAPFTFRLVASCTAGRWYLAAVSGFPVSGNLGVMYSAVCDPFAVLFLPDSAGGWSGTASLTVA